MNRVGGHASAVQHVDILLLDTALSHCPRATTATPVSTIPAPSVCFNTDLRAPLGLIASRHEAQLLIPRLDEGATTRDIRRCLTAMGTMAVRADPVDHPSARTALLR